MQNEESFAGGCQCGRTRYRAAGPRDRASVCYCRMCQRAGAAPFMAFVRFRAHQIEWSEPPAVFASSSAVERGFCRHCGTPLTYRQVAGPFVSLTLMSLDHPEGVRPELRFSPQGEASWCGSLAELPIGDVSIFGGDDFVSHQHQPSETPQT